MTYQFKPGMFLNELRMPFDDALATAKDIGVEYVWFDHLLDEAELADMTDAQIDDMAGRVERHGLKISLIAPRSPFKQIHLTDMSTDSAEDNPVFREQLADLTRTMEIAARLNIGTVLAYTFAWPGEYTADKPTWPMRWMTRGGIIAHVDMEKLVAAFSLVLERAEHHNVDVALAMMPWNYTSVTSHFRALAERLHSPRLKLMWGPADNFNCGEADVATTGFVNVKPYLHSTHDTHAELSLKAISAGKHVYVEKPPAMTLDEARSIQKAVHESGLHWMSGWWFKHSPVTKRLREVIRNPSDVYVQDIGWARRALSGPGRS